MNRKVKKKTRSNTKANKKSRRRGWSVITIDKIEEVRQKLGLSKKHMADQMEVTNSTYHNWIRGVAVANPKTQQRAVNVLDQLMAGNPPINGKAFLLPTGITPTAILVTGQIVPAFLENSKEKVAPADVAKITRGVLEALTC